MPPTYGGRNNYVFAEEFKGSHESRELKVKAEENIGQTVSTRKHKLSVILGGELPHYSSGISPVANDRYLGRILKKWSCIRSR